jgi:hypothetical protein
MDRVICISHDHYNSLVVESRRDPVQGRLKKRSPVQQGQELLGQIRAAEGPRERQ